MPEDYYSNPGDEGDAAPPAAEADQKPSESGDDKMEGETALLPKSILAGKEFKPGDEVIFKVVHLYDDEVEVAYATEKGSKEKSSEEPEDMAAAQDQLSMMAT